MDEKEIRKSLFSVDSNKSPRQDGFFSQFFKKYWTTIKGDLCAAVPAFFKIGVLFKQANTTMLALIPKKQVVQSIMDYRPIAYCTVFYKTVSKILCGRLKPLLPSIVGKEQGAFVEGRCIFENIMLTQSLIKGYGQQGIEFSNPVSNIDNGMHNFNLVRYLGVPLNEGKLNNPIFADLLNKIQNALNHWATHRLSYAGKISLINTVIFRFEQYWCATLLIPKGVIKLITKFCINFLWNSGEGTRKLIMKSWASCCFPYKEGGFNIKEILTWNKSILCKWIWAIDNKSESTWSQCDLIYNIKATGFWTMQIKPHHSESWRGILYVRNELITRARDIENARTILNSCVKARKLKLHLLYDQFREKGNRVT
ncbi:uncharacterized protein LOC141617924 [Silene latifolia]|uniref:uncharacterized protein LOC141617924 n=1 Tax=Silene latifolia TaxID=37657 RepID=UPI003D785B76